MSRAGRFLNSSDSNILVCSELFVWRDGWCACCPGRSGSLFDRPESAIGNHVLNGDWRLPFGAIRPLGARPRLSPAPDVVHRAESSGYLYGWRREYPDCPLDLAPARHSLVSGGENGAVVALSRSHLVRAHFPSFGRSVGDPVVGILGRSNRGWGEVWPSPAYCAVRRQLAALGGSSVHRGHGLSNG